MSLNLLFAVQYLYHSSCLDGIIEHMYPYYLLVAKVNLNDWLVVNISPRLVIRLPILIGGW